MNTPYIILLILRAILMGWLPADTDPYTYDGEIPAVQNGGPLCPPDCPPPPPPDDDN